MEALNDPLKEDLNDLITIEQFIIEQQERFKHSTGAFSRLIRDLSVASKIINRDIRRAGLLDIYGETGDVNIQGERQKKLDVIAHTELVRALKRGGSTVLIGSEEQAETIPVSPNQMPEDRYSVLFDPLDGSSNTDVNVSVGTIFSIYRLPDEVESSVINAALMPGREQVAAGYVIYGSSTMLVYTTGDGVNGFTLEPSIGEFLLSHPNMKTPETGKVYSVNEGDKAGFSTGTRQYIRWLQERNHEGGRPCKTRYIGSFVSDFHRNLLQGGVYMYPATDEHPKGKLRLMYEANPMAFIVEQAGGLAMDGHGNRILDIEPETLHERTPIYIGSRKMVETAEEFVQGKRTFALS